METVWKTATHPETGDKYKIELPAPAVIGQAILELPYSHYGMMPKKTTERLAEKLKLSEEQKNASYKSGDNIFYYIVDAAFRNLLKEGKLQQPGGKRTRYFLVDETYPAPADVRQAILELPYPSNGMSVKDAVEILAEKFELSEEQKNANNKYGDNIFRHAIVHPQFLNLLKEGR